MSTTVALRDDLARRLQTEANSLHTTVEAIVNGVLERFYLPPQISDDPGLQAVVQRIRNTPRDNSAVRPATPLPTNSPLLTATASVDFDEAEWNRQWDEFERDLKTRSLLNAISEAGE